MSNLGTEVNYDAKALLHAALYLRQHGSPHLRSLSIAEVQSRMRKFITEYYFLLADEAFLQTFDGSYDEHLSNDAKQRLAQAAAASPLFIEPRQVTLFPLVPIEVEASFHSAAFFICPPADLAENLSLSLHRVPRDLEPGTFPPVRDCPGERRTPTSWLGISSPTLDAAKQRRAAVLGAVALLPHRYERYQFSGRSMFGGYTTFNGGLTLAFGDPHTPALMENVTIDAEDSPWLTELGDKLVSIETDHRRQMRALEYFYRAWAPDPVKRFPTLFAAMDAIFGDASQATQAVADAVGPVMGPDYTIQRLKLMLKLRASVIHGGAPNVYESSKYEKYYRTYETDPVGDFELIVARCLRHIIFPHTMRERPHTQAELIRRQTGRDI